jgi:SAM-dependent methyltransferase
VAHWQQLRFVAEVKSRFPEFFSGAKVLEIGSWVANYTIREHFQSCDYVGADIAAGSGVDIVTAGQELDLASNSFDVVISCECFEHNPFWLETFLNMSRMLKPGGLFVFTCGSTGRGEHGTRRTNPNSSLTAIAGDKDYYRNLSRRDFENHIALGNHFSHYAFVYNRYMKDLYFAGIKRDSVPEPALDTKMSSLLKAANCITTPEGPTPGAVIGSYGKWALNWGLVKALGEDGYHDFRYRLGFFQGAKTCPNAERD